MRRRLKQTWCGWRGHRYPPITLPVVGRPDAPDERDTLCRNCGAKLYTDFTDSAGTERIRPFNGRSGDPADSLARGCFGIVAAFFFIMAFCAIAGPYLPDLHPKVWKEEGDPYECFGAGRYDAQREGKVCPGYDGEK